MNEEEISEPFVREQRRVNGLRGPGPFFLLEFVRSRVSGQDVFNRFQSP